MITIVRVLFFSIALAVAGTVQAAMQENWKPKKPSDGVLAFKAEISMAKLAAMEASLSQDVDGLAKARATQSDAKADLDKLLPFAIAGAKGKPDLIKAIKGCYVTTQSYLEGIFPTSAAERMEHKRTEGDLDRCEAELQMEMKLSGI